MYLTKFEFNADNLEAIWEAYVGGSFVNYDKGYTKKQFLIQFAEDMSVYTGFWIISNKDMLVAFIFSKYEGEILEPHVVFYANITPRTKIEAYKFFIQSIKDNSDVKACLIRSYINTKQVFEHFVKQGLMQHFRTRLGTKVEYQYLIK